MNTSPGPQQIAVGDWIRIPQLWPGVWQVSRVLSRYKELRWSLDSESIISPRTSVFCERLVNNNWARSFSNQVCEASIAVPVGEEELEKIRTLLDSDNKLREAFARYRASRKPIDLIANVRLGNIGEEEINRLRGSAEEELSPRIEDGITLDEVLLFLKRFEFDRHSRENPNRARLQLASLGHELRGDEFIFRRFSILNF